jgi:hypothetical protein
MQLTLPFTLEKEGEEAATYVEQVASGKRPVVGIIAVSNSVLSSPQPSVIRVTLTFHEGRTALREPPARTPLHWVPPVDADLRPGVRVTVVRNRLGGVASPPEWLEQSLGKTGTVLWTSRLGAMVDLAGQSNWFPYAELERED